MLNRVLTFACVALVGAEAQARRADLVILNGAVVTVDSAKPSAEAVAVKGDRIVAVGTTAEIRKWASAGTRTIDARGRLVIPSFIEGHGHYTGLGGSKLILDLTKARNWDDIVSQVAHAVEVAPRGALIEGRGWHQEKWNRVPKPNVEGVPLHASLDRVSPSNPVVLEHASGHAAFANAAAMKLADITRNTPNPDGGEIVKDSTGDPTGLLKESAQRLMAAGRAKLPKLSRAEEDKRFRKIVELAGADALSKGITSFHDAGNNFATIDGYKKLADEGTLPVRMYVMVRFEPDSVLDANLDRYRLIGYGHNMLTVRSIKQQIDGALGSHGAWLLEPYIDLPTSTGLNLETLQDFENRARIAIKHDFQVNTHAIGDRANREVLNVYEKVMKDYPDKHDLRWRDEHAQHIDPADVPRFKQLGVIASMQGIHTISDAPWLAKRLGEERARKTSYVRRSLIDAGVVVTDGTDVPVEDIDPIMSFYGSVSRKTKDGVVFAPEQKVTRQEGLAMYTLNNAYAAFQEKDLGTITVGKLADIDILSRNIMTIPEDEIPTARVDYTILGGRIKYDRKNAALPGEH